jgi:hypothetical protein
MEQVADAVQYLEASE